MSDLRRALSESAAKAFEAIGLSPDLGRVTASDRPDLADFQCNGALAAAKVARRNPREIAVQVVEALRADERLYSAEIAGLGFINLRMSNGALSARANEIAGDPRAGAVKVADKRRVMIDYGGPNVAKPMHVGHLRASIIGESVKRIFRFRGDEVLGDAHFGDWGFQMGLLIVAVTDEDKFVRELVEAIDKRGSLKPEDEPAAFAALREHVDLETLDRLYPLAAGKAKTDPDYRDRARKATAELQARRLGYITLWRHFVGISRAALQRDFHALGVDFDLWKGESDVDGLIAAMIEDLDKKGVLALDDGAKVVHVSSGEVRTKKRPDGSTYQAPWPDPLIIVSSEGSAMYGTTDVATVIDRKRSFDPQLILYCVDQRQADHFEQVFRTAVRAGYAREGELEHMGFGTMNGPDGKPFKTREGGVLKLGDLIGMAQAKARERLQEAGLGSELAPEEYEATAHKVAVASLKFADLQNYRGTSYVFDLDRFTSFEGKTGPYLLYQAVRIKSLLRKAAEDGAEAGEIIVGEAMERDLVLTLDAFDHAVFEAYDKRAPNFIAEHVYKLAQSFSKFYAACPVIAAPDAATRASRLGLAAVTLKQLETALDLLGIETPDRM